MNARRYTDRRDAGRVLAGMLDDLRGVDDLIVLGLPRGGVPVADEIARSLGAALDVLVVRKVGLPGQPEVAMGAIASIAGTIETVRNPDVMAHARGDAEQTFDRVASAETVELRRRQDAFRGDRPPLQLEGRIVVLVDDGIATGATMRAAVAIARTDQPRKLIVAVPVALSDTAEQLRGLSDDVVCAWEADGLWAVGEAYRDFTQTTDAEVRQILAAASAGR